MLDKDLGLMPLKITSALLSTVLCATASIALTQMKVATSRSILRISLRRLSRQVRTSAWTSWL
jgi:hypothetical protein